MTKPALPVQKFEFLEICFVCVPTFQKSVDNFEILHKTCSILDWSAVPP